MTARITLDVVEVAPFEEPFVQAEVYHPVAGRIAGRTFHREGLALKEAAYQRSVRPLRDALLVVYAMVFQGNCWVASRPIARWRGVACRVRATARTRWERIAPASEQPREVAGGEATATASRGCSGAGDATHTGGNNHVG